MPKTMREQLLALKSRVAEGDADAIAEAAELKAKIENADKAAGLLKFMGDGAEHKAADATARTIGEFAEKNLNLDGIRSGAAQRAATDYGFKAYTDPIMAPTITDVDRRVVDVPGRDIFRVRDLFGAETISGNSLQYFVLGQTEQPVDGAPAGVDEGDAKPQFSVEYSPETATLQKIAGWYYETDELIEDAPFLKSSIDNRGLFELDKAIEAFLVDELGNTTGIGSEEYAFGGAMDADTIFKAMMDIKGDTNYDADAIVINPADYQDLRLAKDGNDQYYGGGYFTGAYANGGLAVTPGIWGLTTIVTNAVPAGSAIVGAFRAGASVLTKAGSGARVEVVTGDHDDRTHNRVTVIVEERLALAVRVPAAFVAITEAASE